MQVGKIERINITFDSEELNSIAFMIRNGLELTIKQHINNLQDPMKEGSKMNARVFEERNRENIEIMKTFLALSGRMDGDYYEKQLFEMIKKDDK